MAIRVFDIIVGIIIVAMFVGGMSAYFVQVNQIKRVVEILY